MGIRARTYTAQPVDLTETGSGRRCLGMGALRTILLAALAAALLVSLPGASRAAGCTITWVGDVDSGWTTSDGGDTNWTDDRLPNGSDVVCIDDGDVNLAGAGASVTSYEIADGASLTVMGVRLAAGAGSSNAGTLTLAGGGARLHTENGDSTNAETLTNTGTIVSTGDGGSQDIAGDLSNQGTLTIGHPQITLHNVNDGRNPKLTNTGQITLQAGGHLFAAGTVRQSGKISGGGALDVDTSGRLEVAGGSIAATSTVVLTGGTGNCCGNVPGAALDFVGASSATGTVSVTTALGGRHALSGDVPEGFEVVLADDGVLVAGADWANAGTVRLAGARSRLTTEDGDATTVETLTNSGSLIAAGTGDDRRIGGDIVNEGTVSARHEATRFQRADGNRQSVLTNRGTLEATAAGTLTFEATTLVQDTDGDIAGRGRSTCPPAAGCRCRAGRSPRRPTSTSPAAAATAAATPRAPRWRSWVPPTPPERSGSTEPASTPSPVTFPWG